MSHCTTPFEGSEKKLEIIFSPPKRGILSRGNDCWEPVVRRAGAKIVSRISNNRVDAYLLSESSLFVWEDRILMITCGRTALIRAVPAIVNIVGRENVALIFYERKNPMFPSDQQGGFEADMVLMEKAFSGDSYRLGPTSGDHVDVFYASPGSLSGSAGWEKDATLQVLMNELDPVAMETFSADNAGSPVQAAVLLRLNTLYEGMTSDSHFFSPCGYSLNGIRENAYYTVHVTPQPNGSFASFETNLIEEDYMRVITEMVAVFKPGRFSVVLTASTDDNCRPLHASAAGKLKGYAVVEKSRYALDCDYDVTYLNHKIK